MQWFSRCVRTQQEIRITGWARSGLMRRDISGVMPRTETRQSRLALLSMVNAVLAHGPGGTDRGLDVPRI